MLREPAKVCFGARSWVRLGLAGGELSITTANAQEPWVHVFRVAMERHSCATLLPPLLGARTVCPPSACLLNIISASSCVSYGLAIFPSRHHYYTTARQAANGPTYTGVGPHESFKPGYPVPCMLLHRPDISVRATVGPIYPLALRASLLGTYVEILVKISILGYYPSGA